MPLPPVNFSNVNITIQQFQEIASGKYNAGEVRLASETSLDKINHRVTFRGDNKVSLSHAEVLAVKQAFVNALRQSGVGADEVARVRAQLGLDPERPVDVELKRRSLKPLSRQQIRNILDRNADAINQHVGEGTIRSHAQIWGERYTERQRDGFARTRRQVNAELVESRATIPDRSVQDTQAVLSGDVVFRSPADRERLIAEALRVKQAILTGSGGNPRNQPGATIRITRPNGELDVKFSLGGSEADAMRRLDDEILLMRSTRQPTDEERAVRGEFRSLPDANARSAWVGRLATDPQGGFKARTIAIGLLLQNGVSDWETLSRVNRISDFAAVALLSDLVNHSAGLRDDALRQSPAVANLANQLEAAPIPPESQAYVPALSPREILTAAKAGLNGDYARSSHEMKTVHDRVVATLRARYGADVMPRNAQLTGLADGVELEHALGDGTVRRTVDEMTTDLVALMSRSAARLYLAGVLKPMLRAAGGAEGLATAVATNLLTRHPDLRDRLVAAQTPEAANAAVQEFRQQIEAGVRRQLTADRLRAAAVDEYRSLIADALGVPVSALAGRAVSVTRIQDKGLRIAAQIGDGTNPADSDDEIALVFRTLANDFAQERIALLNQADALDIAPEARDTIKDLLLRIGKVTGLGLAALRQVADGIDVADLANAFAAGEGKDDILRRLGTVGTNVRNATMAAIGGQDGMLDEVNDAAGLVLVLALAKRPEIFDHLRTFFARNDVTDQDFTATAGPAANAGAFLVIKPDEPVAETNAALADSIGSPRIAPVPAQALYRALDDLGFDDLPAADKAALLAGPDGQALAQKIRTAATAVTPSQLRGLAQMQFARSAARHALMRHLDILAAQHNIDATGILGDAADVLFRRNPALRDRLAAAVSRAAARGEDPVAAMAGPLADDTAAALAALRSLGTLRRAEADAREDAVREIALRAALDEAVVREKLDAGALADSLAALRTAVADQLANPATNVANWDADDVHVRASGCVESFVLAKVGFLAEVLDLPVPADVRGALVVSALEDRTCADREIPAAAGRMLRRDDVRAVFDYARNMLAADKVAQISDDDLLLVFETIGMRLDAAVAAELTAEKRAEMGDAGHAVLRGILSAALAGHCGDTLVAAAARLVADGRLDAIDARATAAANGPDARPALATARRLLAEVRTALHDDWLPAPLAEAIRTGATTAVQKAVADALEKRAPDLVARLGAGLDPAKAARLKAFAITLDYRDHALETAEKTLRAAADALRAAASVEAAEARLAELAGGVFRAEDAAAFVAAAAQASRVALDEAQTAKAVALVAEFGAGMPAKNARLLARFAANLRLTDRSAELDRRRVAFLAPQLAGWRDFKLADPGKETISAYFKDEANALLRDYLRPEQAAQFANDVFGTMSVDAGRGFYTIAGMRFDQGHGREVVGAFANLNLPPAAKRALSVLMSQASALPVLDLQMKIPDPPNDGRPEPFDASSLPGGGEFVSRGIPRDPELFLSLQVADKISSIYDLTVSGDGTTATLKVVKSAQLLVGTEDSRMATHFGSVVVEEEMTVDIASETPTVRSVRVSQVFDVADDLHDRYLLETAPIPPPPPVPPAAVPVL